MLGWFQSYNGTLEGKALFITGCDTGFGRVMALKFCEEGAHVYAGCLTQEGVDYLSAAARGKGKITTVILNVTSDEEVQRAFAFVKAELERQKQNLYAVVNNAGINGGWYVEMTDMDQYKRIMEINYFGPVRVTKAFLPLLDRSVGRMVGVVSSLGLYSMKGISAYAGSKFAHNAFMDALRNELRYSGIKVVKIFPGGHKTEGVKTYRDDVGSEKKYSIASDDVKSRYQKSLVQDHLKVAANALKYFGDPINVVNAIRTAILLKNPKAGYYVGGDAHFMGKCMSILPTGCSDCLQNKMA